MMSVVHWSVFLISVLNVNQLNSKNNNHVRKRGSDFIKFGNGVWSHNHHLQLHSTKNRKFCFLKVKPYFSRCFDLVSLILFFDRSQLKSEKSDPNMISHFALFFDRIFKLGFLKCLYYLSNDECSSLVRVSDIRAECEPTELKFFSITRFRSDSCAQALLVA